MSQVLPERRSEGDTQRYEAGSDLEQVSERLRRMLDQTFVGFALPSLVTAMAAWSPPVDIEEHDDAYVVEAELPGVDRKDVNIELVGNELTITGEIKERERKGVLRRRTRKVGRFDFRVTLPEQVDPDGIDAKLDGGVLTVRIPKAQQAQRRQVEIK
jgi:HSP20 family protein